MCQERWGEAALQDSDILESKETMMELVTGTACGGPVTAGQETRLSAIAARNQAALDEMSTKLAAGEWAQREGRLYLATGEPLVCVCSEVVPG